MSITDELRKYADRLSDEAARKSEHGFSPVAMELERIADRIDAEHEAKVSYWQGASYKDGYDEGFASADDWLGQHEDAMAEHGWIRLPVDANGVPISVGDELTDGEYTFVVGELATFGDGSWSIRNEDGDAWEACDVTRHHKPTVEDVLREFALKCEDAGYAGPKVEEIASEFAERLQLKERDDD
jgi:hypothetical protein